MHDTETNVIIDTVIQFYLDETRQQVNRQQSDIDTLDSKLRDISTNAGIIATIAASIFGAAITVVYTSSQATKLGLPIGSLVLLTLAVMAYLTIVFTTMIGLLPKKYQTSAPNTWTEVNTELLHWGTSKADTHLSKQDFYKSAINTYIQIISDNNKIVKSKEKLINLASVLLPLLTVFILAATTIATIANIN